MREKYRCVHVNVRAWWCVRVINAHARACWCACECVWLCARMRVLRCACCARGVRLHAMMLRAVCCAHICVCVRVCKLAAPDFMFGARPCSITQTHDDYKKPERLPHSEQNEKASSATTALCRPTLSTRKATVKLGVFLMERQIRPAWSLTPFITF